MIAEIKIDKNELEKIIEKSIRENLASLNVEIMSIKEDVNWVDQYFDGLVIKVKTREVAKD